MYCGAMGDDCVVVDLRSDTVTQPSEAMRRAMATAKVGDDVFGEDPTVNALEARVAQLLGKPAALFLPSGIMANLVAVMVHCRERGAELLCGDKSHMYLCEQGGASTVAGVLVSTTRNLPDGTLDIEELESRVRGGRPHEPRTTLLAVENTHNRCGGKVLDAAWMARVGAKCRRLGLLLHVDGARLWNACEALGVEPASLVAAADSVSVCFSKGLGAPVGSALAGTEEFIQRARRARKVLGGGMRQAGVLAAAALVALDESLPALYSDHRRAQYIAKAVNDLKLSWAVAEVSTNMVFVRATRAGRGEADRLLERLGVVAADEPRTGGATVVRAFTVDPATLRLVLHRDIDDDLLRRASEKLTLVLREINKQ